MNDNNERFRDKQPIAWTFHRNTSRWIYNAMSAGKDTPPAPPKENADLPAFSLPSPTLPPTTFQELLTNRFSCRHFTDQPLTLNHLSTLLHFTYGILGKSHFGNVEFLERPLPSGGGLYPLELYVIVQKIENLEPGIYHYFTIGHALEQLRSVLLPSALREYLLMGQEQLAAAPVIVVFTAVVARSLVKYGDRGYRYILFEAGHAAQNLNLTASALGLGSCNIGGFFDQDLGDLLHLDREREIPLYAVSIGHPSQSDRQT